MTCKKWADHAFEPMEGNRYRCVHCTFTVNGEWFESLDSKDQNLK